jgi:hypothetical protein
MPANESAELQIIVGRGRPCFPPRFGLSDGLSLFTNPLCAFPSPIMVDFALKVSA